jgi:hypothetical protein
VAEDNSSGNKPNPSQPNPSQLIEVNAWKTFLNPVVAIAGMILAGVLFLLFTAIVGWDKGHVLQDMGKIEYARGLITYLFAVVTIGTAVLLVVSALIAPADDAHNKQFERGKEILSLLLGVFGTIVGFYFGSEVAKGAEQMLRLAPIHVSATTVAPNAKFSLVTVVSGGLPPYRYGVSIDGPPSDTIEEVDKTGWIEKELTAPQTDKEQSYTVTLRVEDAHGHEAQQSTKITVSPPH